jgi:hypothetical protein
MHYIQIKKAWIRCCLRRQGIGGIKGLYKSLTSFGNNSSSGFGYTPTKFYCMNCGYEHREYACPKCGSKAVKVWLLWEKGLQSLHKSK